MGKSSIIFSIIFLAISLIVIANVLPTGLNTIATVNTSTWDSGVGSMFTSLIPLIVIFAIIMGLLQYMKNRE